MKYIDVVKVDNIDKMEIIQEHCPSDFGLPDHDEASLYVSDGDPYNLMVASKKVVGCGGFTCGQCWNRNVDSKINLCNTCSYTLPECNPEKVTYGTGLGNDNIIDCSQYNCDSI